MTKITRTGRLLANYGQQTGDPHADHATLIVDIITDLMCYAGADGIDWPDVERRARDHYAAERQPGWPEIAKPSTTCDSTNLPPVDNYEMNGCQETEGAVEQCDDADAQFFTVYSHRTGQGVEAVQDFNHREEAVAVCNAFNMVLEARGDRCANLIGKREV